MSNKIALKDLKHLLVPRGVFVAADPFKKLKSIAGNTFRRQKVGYLLVDRGDRKILTELAEQVRNGTLEAGHFLEVPFDDIDSALDVLKNSGRIGRTVLAL